MQSRFLFIPLCLVMINQQVRDILLHNAAQYETTAFLSGDPSWFMHQVTGSANQEAIAFVASCLSYGNRKQFMPKIDFIMRCSNGDPDQWICNGYFRSHFMQYDKSCFYRLYTHADMFCLFSAYQQMLQEYGSLKDYVRSNAATGIEAVECICAYFTKKGSGGIIPKDATSPCKRICMFLRWMVRDSSPVDLGLWADFIDRRTLIIPLDTHVLQQSVALGLLKGKTTSMSVAQRLTRQLAEVFPEDPLLGDFALFGYGVNAV